MNQFRTLPIFGGDQRATADVVNGIMNGKTNNTGSITLATGGATTTALNDRRIGVDSVIIFVKASAAAFADANLIYASNQGAGTATVNHVANSTADKTYKYVVVG
jgi:hypothetical protein